MAKIMLVEDDNNLRQIYEDRLAAEGYQIVSAPDGEAALALAVKERPDLIIADVMMPKVSGFDMLDILRSTPETKDAKIIMMTALSQAEDQARAEKLGADKYLVKSQVTLEDVVEVAAQMLGDQPGGTSAAATTPEVTPAALPSTPAASPTSATIPVTAPPVDNPAAVPPPPAATAVEPDTAAPALTPEPSSSPAVTTPPAPSASVVVPAAPALPPSEPTKPASVSIPVTSTDDEATTPQATPQPSSPPTEAAAASNETAMKDKIDEFIASNPTLSDSADSTDTTQASASTPTPAAPTADAPTPTAAPITSPKTEPVSPPSETPAGPDDSQSSSAMAAVDGLLSDTKSAAEPTAAPPNKPADTYVADKQSSDTPESQSMVHTKRIEPTSDLMSKTPDLNELLAKEAEHSTPTPPPVNSVITPGGGSISPLPGSSVQDAIEGGTKPDDTPANDITL